MANKIIIKNGSSAPGAGTLQSSELGFDKENKKLYIGLEGEDVAPLLVNPPEVTVDLNGASSSESIQIINADSLGGIPASDFATREEANTMFVSVEGDAMTGMLTVPAIALKTGGGYSRTIRMLEEDGSQIGSIGYNTAGQMLVRQYNLETGKNEYYRLPAVTEGLSANNGYYFLTSRDPVTVAQGGTGAKTIEEAKANFGVGAELWTGSWSSGDITVPDTDKYTMFLIKLANYSLYIPAIKYSSNIRGLGGYAAADSVISAQFAGTFSGNTWTLANANSMIHKPDGSQTLAARNVEKIIGLI